MRGRGRQGTSYLLRRLAAATDGFDYQAVEEEQRHALAGFGAALGEHLGIPGGRLAIDSWNDARAVLDDLPSRDANAVVVIDEFPYTMNHSPQAPHG